MIVTMRAHFDGERDGKPWPDTGGSIDLPAGEAKALIASGYAVADEAPAEVPDEAPKPRRAKPRKG